LFTNGPSGITRALHHGRGVPWAEFRVKSDI
jgi:hypothetical protein